MRRHLDNLHLYPNGGLDLRRVLADKYELQIDNVVVGSGSDAIIANIIRAFLCDEDEVLTTEAAFIGFQVVAKSRGVAYRTVPYREWRYDLTALADAVNERTKIIYLANPNNPDRYPVLAPGIRCVLQACSGARAHHSGRGVFRVCPDNPRYPGLDALSLRQRDHAAHVLEDLRPGRGTDRLWLRARRPDPERDEGEAPFEPARSRRRPGSPRWATPSSCTAHWN